MKRLSLIAAGPLMLGAGLSQAGVIEASYTCERGVEIPVAYIDGGEEDVVTLIAEGQLVVLPRAVSGSGARYTAAEGDSYVWWDHGNEATLAWFDSEKGEEVTLFAFCETSD